ncbi:hypothetical protein ACN20G_32905 (plasmid) [Streptomyces sp. BI20]|uniref:hypothetical protein n=1 Tax=Streptomyces sp. BI20 TaxID=3403460 RepID=UPI003C75BDFF
MLAKGVEQLVLDLRGVTYADPELVSWLVELHRMVPITLVGPLPGHLVRMLEADGPQAGPFTLIEVEPEDVDGIGPPEAGPDEH